ncbi:TPA_asm: RNA-dependent RNA polymerase [birds-foot trefoil-associated virus]|uniref:RNA-directed RNA polymerase n=1 Tax=birds-foot trefoil-associated virus TaxID=3121202 RepID=A0A9Y0T8I4_9RHAB|nr:TPA_asm: RNA-dependent RNA polymerase [Bird's-foot trefoil nucleorhabdovirus]
MENHWDGIDDWDKRDQDPDSDQTAPSIPTSPGNFHCKSALRSHESNLKLFLYRRSFTHIMSMTGSGPYTEDVVLLVPDLWNCFYLGTHGLDRVFSPSKSKIHSEGSPSLVRWASSTVDLILDGSYVKEALSAEAHIWQLQDHWVNDFERAVYPTIIGKMKRVIYLVYFLNLSLIVLNHRHNDKRPDVNVVLSGVVKEDDDDLYQMVFNQYLSLTIYHDCVRVVTPVFDQILQKDVYLNICDKINERFNVLLGSHVISYTACYSPSDKGNYDVKLNKVVHNIIQWGDTLLYKHKNRAYELIGKYEAYCVSSIIMRDDPDVWNNREFQDNLLEDDKKNNPDMYQDAISLCTLLNGEHEAILAEVHGLWRIWGHPIIDLEGGLKKMEATCTKTHNISRYETMIGYRTFKLTFAKNYFDKHGHYPLSSISSQDDYEKYSDHLLARDREDYEATKGQYDELSYIHRCLRSGRRIEERNSEYRHSDWDNVSFLQNFQVPQSVNLATMIKDKAISQTRTELVESVSARNSVFDPKKRRGVLKWLSEQTVRLKNYLLNIDQHGLAEEDRIIGLYPKERELKTKARFFSLMSYNMRMYVTATEELLGRYLLPYFPMITMSDTLLNMIIRLFNMTTNIGVSGSKVTYSMNIDFSKWNQNMREATNASIFNEIDRILGFRALISRTHSIFRTSYLYLCSGEYIPRIIRGMLTSMSPYSRIGDESGKEGLRQKGWTITTVCDILSLAFLHGVKIELIGGGDNQVLTIEIRSQGRNLQLPEAEQMRKIQERMNRFRNALAKKMEKRGLPLKLEETWISHRLLMYNKIMYLSGVPLPGRLKVVSRLFGNSNEGILTLGNITSTLGTGYQSLSSKDYDPIFSWIMSRTFTLIAIGQYFLFNPTCGVRRLDHQILLTKDNLKRNKAVFGYIDDYIVTPRKMLINATSEHTLSCAELYYICLYYHKILGGPGIGSPTSYIMKGFPDPLSEALTFNYGVISHASSTVMKTIVENLTAVAKSNVMHWEHLLEDPVSINHNAPSHGVAALREQAERILKQADIQNIKFKELISIGDTEYLRKLSETLCRPDHLEPRLLHDIVGSTIPGYVNTILSKVDQSSTLGKLATSIDIVTSVYTSEIEYYMFLAKKVHIREGHHLGSCPTEDARALRNGTWGKNIIGVTTPHPAAFLQAVCHTTNDIGCDQNYITTLVKRNSSPYAIKRGEFRPYFGSYTAEKFKSSVLASAYGDEDILKRAIKIQKLLGWRYKAGTMMHRVIQGILSCVTDSDPNKFLPTIEEITGDVEHRYHDMATKHGGIPSNLIKYYTYVSCNTTTFINHSKGAANESLHYQAAIIYCCMTSILRTLGAKDITKVHHFHETCSKCIQPIQIPPEDQTSLQGVELMSCPTNELMYIREEDIPVHYSNHIAFLRSQEKTAHLRVNDDTVVQFTLRKERISWLVLVCASLMTTGDRMKTSALRLIVAELSYLEAIWLIKTIIFTDFLLAKIPPKSADGTQYTEAHLKYKKVLMYITTDVKLSKHLDDIGIMYTGDEDYVGDYLRQISTIPTEDIDNAVHKAIGKYQDPEYNVSWLIICSAKNPSLQTCPVCVNHIIDHIKDKRDEWCSIHGQLDTTIMYHMYSLDKLSRYKGPPYAPKEEQASSSKRKRTSIFESIKMARNKSSGRAIRLRRSGFMYNSSKVNEEVISELLPDWVVSTISVEGCDNSDKVIDGWSLSQHHEMMDGLPQDIGCVIGQAMSICRIIKSTQRDMGGDGGDNKEIRVAWEVPIRPDSSIIVSKILSLVNQILIQFRLPRVKMTLFCGEMTNLEDLELRYLDNVVSDYQTTTNSLTSRLIVLSEGDGCLDVIQCTSNKEVVIFCSASSALYVNRDFFLITNSEKAYQDIFLIDNKHTRDSQTFKVQILQPTTSVSEPYPVILLYSPSSTHFQVSDSLLIAAISSHAPYRNQVLCNQIVNTVHIEHRVSVHRQLYKELISHNLGIVDESSYISVMKHISAGIYNFALKASVNERMPWRCIALINLMLGIKILTDSDRAAALQYYTTLCHSISFKPGTYKVIQLHKKALPNARAKGLINWTPGSVGDSTRKVVHDIETWLIIKWNTDHDKTPFLEL